MSQDGTLDTPRMPVAEHRRQLGNVLFQFAHGFGQVMRGVADAAGPLASLGPMFEEAVDPRRDTRPDADGIFNPAFVDIPEPLKQSARDHRRTVHVNDVRAAWTRCEWGHMAYVPLIGETAMLARKADFVTALPHLGTKLVAYHASENFVCREYGFLGAVVVAAELWPTRGSCATTPGTTCTARPPCGPRTTTGRPASSSWSGSRRPTRWCRTWTWRGTTPGGRGSPSSSDEGRWPRSMPCGCPAR